MNFILYAMVLISFTPNSWNGTTRKEWRPMGEFANIEACQKAAEELKFKEFKCIDKYTRSK